MSHPVSAYFDVPHGVANAILLPTVLEYNALADTGKYEKIYGYISGGYKKTGKREFEAYMLPEAVRDLNASLGIPATLSEVGVTGDKLDCMAKDAMKSGNILVNPRSTTEKDVIDLYKKSM
jgi:alcohol dehydrogenase